MESVNNLFLKARAMLDEYTEDGSIIPDADVIDMKMKSILLADMAHKELFESARVDLTKTEPKTFTSINDVTEVNYKADQAIANFIASRIAPFENKSLVNFLDDEYKRLKAAARNKAIAQPITDVYGGGTDV